MPNLEREVAAWRQAMVAGSVTDPAVLDELESHLRDYVEQQVRAGCDAGQAFQAGVARIGQPAALQREFLRADKGLSAGRVAAFLNDWRKCLWFALGFAVLIGAGFYAWNVRVTPIYAGVATVELQGLRQQQMHGQEVRAAELLNTAMQLLASGRMRSRVVGSFTQAETNILRRPTRLVPGEQPAPFLGSLSVGTMRMSFVATVSVIHFDADAAALVANRYVREWQAELANSANFDGISVRVIDVATPSHEPFTPNRPHILSASLRLAAVTFMGLLVVAALLRKFVGARPGAGPQLKIG